MALASSVLLWAFFGRCKSPFRGGESSGTFPNAATGTQGAMILSTFLMISAVLDVVTKDPR